MRSFGPSLTIVSVAFVALGPALVAGCFESGPLALTTGSLADDTATSSTDTAATTDSSTTITTVDVDDTADAQDVGATDTDDPSDAQDDADAGDTVVVPDVADTVDTTDTADVVVRACLIDDDCDDLEAVDLCNGPIRCVDYGCRPDPSAAVTCVDPIGTPCTDVACNPATGACEQFATCACDTSGALACGQVLQFSTNDFGAAERVDAYGCGPPAGPWIERRFDFAPPAGRVRLDLTSTGAAGLHVLAPDAGGQCDPIAGCVAGAASRLYLDATGQAQVVAVDFTAPESLVTVRATCGITTETECDDGQDDDGDAALDCADPDCNGVGGCPLVLTQETGYCVGGIDDDDDGFTDCADPDCGEDAACLEPCEVTTVNVGCGFHQGAPTGGGKARATHYACTPTPAPGKEVVYRFRPDFSGPVVVTFSGSPGLQFYLLVETGRGCTPRDCVATSTTGLTFDAVAGTTYYLGIDAPAGVTGNYDLQVTCP